MLYAESIITTCCTNHTDVQKGIGKSIIDFADDLLTQIFSGKYKNIIIPEMMLETAQKLWQGVRSEWGKTENINRTSDTEKWLNRVHNNIYAFSAAKSYTQLVELRNAVFDTNGKTRSFTQFRESAKTILDKYNELYLETEYEAVVRSTVMGRQWLDIQRDKDVYPYLKYVTAGDERVRISHRELEGKIFPVDSEFWKKFYPPNGWNCRCTVKKLQETNEVSNLEETLKTAEASTPDYWKKNVGTSEIFDPKQTPYFDGFPKRPLEAVKDYGLQPVSRIANRADLLELALPLGDTKALNKVYDYDDFLLQKHTSIINEKYFSLIDNVAQKPDEVWTKDVQRIFIQYRKEKSLVMVVDDTSTVIGIISVPNTELEIYRKGILNYRE